MAGEPDRQWLREAFGALARVGWFGRHHPAIGHALGMSR
jgi:hypothetical protein